MNPVGQSRIARLRGPLALVLAAWWLAFVAETGPHLVHHLFDPDGEAECAFLAAAHHAPAATQTPVPIPQPLPASEEPLVAAPSVRAASSLRSPTCRAPPVRLLASA